VLREQAGVTDRRAVAAAFLSVIERLSDPVLLAIDDLRWLDPTSVHVIAFAARRLSGPVGFLGIVRTEPTAVEPHHGCNYPGLTPSTELRCVRCLLVRCTPL
jgi:hypothetical protein